MERFTVGLFVIVFPLWLLAQHGADPAARGRALAAFLLPFAFLQLGTYRLVQRFGPYALLAAGCAGYGAAFAALGRVGEGPDYPILMTLGALAALIFPPTLALTAEWTAPETRASALAGFNVPSRARRLRLGPRRRRLGAPRRRRRGRQFHRRLRPGRRRRRDGRHRRIRRLSALPQAELGTERTARWRLRRSSPPGSPLR